MPLMPCTDVLFNQVTRMRPRVVAGPATIQLYVPDVLAVSGALAAIVVHVEPPSPLNSMSTDSAVPRLWLHVMFCVDPIAQTTFFLFGAVTARAGVASVNGTSLTSPSAGVPAGLT